MMSSGAGGAHGRSLTGLGFRVLLACAIATVVLGLYGYSQEPLQECGAGVQHGFWHYFEAIYKTIALFHIEHANADSVARCYPNIAVAIAAVLGPAAFLATVGSIAWVLLDDQRKAWALRRARNHLVVIGYGAKGRERAHEGIHEGRHVVVAIEPSPTEAATAHARENGVLLLEGDAHDPRILARARVEHAASISIATGADARNLALARTIVERIGKGRGRIVHASVNSPLVRRAVTATEIPGAIDIFSTEQFAAYALCDAARFFEIADLLGQRRVHIVILGFGSLAIHLAPQIIRTSVVACLEPPAVTILCPRPDEARNALRLAYPGTESVAEVRTIEYHPLGRPVDDAALIEEVEKGGPVTAIVALSESGFDAIANALAVRETSHRTGRWRAPIFFSVDTGEHFAALEHPLKTAKRYTEVLQSFDTSAALSTIRHTRERDRIARAVHGRFLQVQRDAQAQGKQLPVTEALHEWDELPLTYRQAGRRAADHIPAKLASIGCFVPHGVNALSRDVERVVESPMFEILAELEHEAWSVDRRLEGWRAGPVRDNRAMIHDQLVPYAQLSEGSKDLDRDQVRTLFTGTLPHAREHTQHAVRFDLWIGFIGGAANKAETARLAGAVGEAVKRIIEARPDHYITLVSALAPGADLIATKKALAALDAARRSHRLLVANAMRFRDAVDGFEAQWRGGAIADLEGAADGDWATERARILNAIDQIVTRPVCQRVFELDGPPLGSDETARQRGYRLQSAYIVERAHVVLAAVKSGGAKEPGGADEAILWRRDPSAIPEEFRRYRHRPNPLGDGLPGLITIDLDSA
jgi:Trk K+ transport system NAD-binding subunit